jgi:hypothetical protein
MVYESGAIKCSITWAYGREVVRLWVKWMRMGMETIGYSRWMIKLCFGVVTTNNNGLKT